MAHEHLRPHAAEGAVRLGAGFLDQRLHAPGPALCLHQHNAPEVVWALHNGAVDSLRSVAAVYSTAGGEEEAPMRPEEGGACWPSPSLFMLAKAIQCAGIPGDVRARACAICTGQRDQFAVMHRRRAGVSAPQQYVGFAFWPSAFTASLQRVSCVRFIWTDCTLQTMAMLHASARVGV